VALKLCRKCVAQFSGLTATKGTGRRIQQKVLAFGILIHNARGCVNISYVALTPTPTDLLAQRLSTKVELIVFA